MIEIDAMNISNEEIVLLQKMGYEIIFVLEE